MDAREILESVEDEVETSERFTRRIALRYRLAKMLTRGLFDEALATARAAYSQEEIRERDLRFVAEIVEAADRVRVRR